jgi:hypothetical protein
VLSRWGRIGADGSGVAAAGVALARAVRARPPPTARLNSCRRSGLRSVVEEVLLVSTVAAFG